MGVKVKDFISIGKVAIILGVSICTLRRWHKDKKLIPGYITYGGHRRYNKNKVFNLINKHKQSNNKMIIGYARVSSYDQKNDLKTQANRISLYIKENFNTNNYEIIKDLGSGLNYNKKGIRKLLKLICENKISNLVITNKDRLLRFGSEIIFDICKHFNIKVFIINEDNKTLTFEQQLCNNIISIITVFSAKLYGSRSHKNKKAIIVK